jgi:hypothetical protein
MRRPGACARRWRPLSFSTAAAGRIGVRRPCLGARRSAVRRRPVVRARSGRGGPGLGQVCGLVQGESRSSISMGRTQRWSAAGGGMEEGRGGRWRDVAGPVDGVRWRDGGGPRWPAAGWRRTAAADLASCPAWPRVVVLFIAFFLLG